jgi:hypothetical protein
MSKRTMIKGQTTIYKILHGKLKIKQYESLLQPWVYLCNITSKDNLTCVLEYGMLKYQNIVGDLESDVHESSCSFSYLYSTKGSYSGS